jgi:hypothetical protein
MYACGHEWILNACVHICMYTHMHTHIQMSRKMCTICMLCWHVNMRGLHAFIMHLCTPIWVYGCLVDSDCACHYEYHVCMHTFTCVWLHAPSASMAICVFIHVHDMECLKYSGLLTFLTESARVCDIPNTYACEYMSIHTCVCKERHTILIHISTILPQYMPPRKL